MSILSELYDQCSSCNVETLKKDLENGVCAGCRSKTDVEQMAELVQQYPGPGLKAELPRCPHGKISTPAICRAFHGKDD